ncbi:ral guanine nucleotide dissociation stimulator-like 1 [Stigmatopora nigra]
MRTLFPVSDGGEPHSLRTKMSRMKKLLGLNHSVDNHVDMEPVVWLRNFQLLDSEEQYEGQVQEWREEDESGAVFGITLRREPVVASENMAMAGEPTDSTYVHYQTVKLRRLKAGTLEHLVTHLLDAECQEPDYVHIFLSTYRAFTSTSNLIELLFQSADSTTFCLQSALLPVIKLWLGEYNADFHEPPQYQTLRLLCAKLRRRLCFRRLAQTAATLLKTLQEQDHCQFTSLDDRGLFCCKERDRETFMSFPVSDFAEQLTRLDMELFVKVLPFHCLGCVWSQRDKKENRYLPTTVRATIAQFNTVTNHVITSLLCPPSPSPSTSSPISSSRSPFGFLCHQNIPGRLHSSHSSPSCRARVIERWISVAQACRQLRNFSSLRAILSALQSNAVYRLKKTWEAVCKESMVIFKHLCETFPDENCELATQEILTECGTRQEVSTNSSSPLLGSKKVDQGGSVPYLGSYLTVLTMLDTALPDSVEGGLINFEKRRRECEILSQIRQLQASCSQYQLTVNPRITNWLQSYTLLLTDQESYELSRELEPPVDPCPNSPNLWSGHFPNKKLASSQATSDCSLRKANADQMSVSSSSSSSSDTDDLNVPHSSALRLKLKSLSSSMHNINEDYMSSSSSPVISSSSHPDLSCSSSSSSSLSIQPVLPVYNKQLDGSCIIRVSIECVNNGNIYKSILLTSQDHTPQIIQRALDKHNLEETFSCQDFTLCQMLNNGNELHIPDKSNVYYAMCTTSNYDFVLHQRWRSHGRHKGSCSSLGTLHSNICTSGLS